MNDAFKKFDLTGKTALVTGGATGIGYFMTRGLARSGARVMVCARRENLLRQAADTLNAERPAGEVLFRTVDLGNRDSVQDLARHALETLGGVDIFIGNAGQDMFEPVDKITDQTTDQMFQVNFTSNLQLFRAFLPHMRGNRWGRVIFTSSATSVCSSAQEGMGMYTATKGALNAFARTAATETGHDGITVNSLLPGVFLTPMIAEMEGVIGKEGFKNLMGSFTSMTALGRLAQCDEIEGVIQLLASDAGSYITGSSLVIDGGLSIMMKPNVTA